MRIRPAILYRYIFGEVFTPFATTLFVFTGILFLIRSLRLVELVINKNVPLGDILTLFSYIIPRFLEIALPMSLLLGILIAFGRLSADSEIVVVRASGISLRQLVKPVLAFSLAAFIITLVVGFWVRPWANNQLAVGIFEIAKMRARAGLVPGIFNEFGPLTIYAEKIEDEGKRLENVIIADATSKENTRTFIAEHGRIVSDDFARSLTLRLYEGSIFEGSASNYNITQFDINNINLGEEALSDDEPLPDGKRTSELYIDELSRFINALQKQKRAGKLDKHQARQLARSSVEWHKRLVVPTSCLCISLVAMALGIQPSRGGHTWGMGANIVVGVLVIVLYYLLFALMSALGKEEVVPAWSVMWIPNILFAWIAVYLFRQVESERWLAVSQAMGDLHAKIFKKLKFFFGDQRGQGK